MWIFNVFFSNDFIKTIKLIKKEKKRYVCVYENKLWFYLSFKREKFDYQNVVRRKPNSWGMAFFIEIRYFYAFSLGQIVLHIFYCKNARKLISCELTRVYRNVCVALVCMCMCLCLCAVNGSFPRHNSNFPRIVLFCVEFHCVFITIVAFGASHNVNLCSLNRQLLCLIYLKGYN